MWLEPNVYLKEFFYISNDININDEVKHLLELANKFLFFQVCDDQWHHYAINVRFPDVELYLDGQLFRSEKKNPEVIDDWPLHPTKGINTTLTVGACWQVNHSKWIIYEKDKMNLVTIFIIIT